jgi:amino acid adenylation domain-containing protein
VIGELAPVTEALAARARERPDAPALVCDGHSLSYGELDARANQLARELGARGVPAGGLVSVVLERSVELLPTLLGILRARAAYVPVDPGYPPARIADILEQAAAPLIVTQSSLVSGLLPGVGTPMLLIDEERSAIERQPPEPLQRGAQLEDLAYVIFTSGSSGRPKGVMLAHRGLANLMRTMSSRPGLAAGETMLGVTTPAFDLSVPDLYLPLSVGATLVLASAREAADPRELMRMIAAHDVALMQATPSTWRMLLDAGWSGRRRSLRAVCGGEALAPALAQELVGRVGEVWNFYGPTEATVWSTCARIDAGAEVTIGSELPGVSCHIVGEAGEPAPLGAPGELLIGGVQVARGYLHRPELTAERFISDRFSGAAGARLYRTGDRARRRPDGAIEFLGRLDHQVKLRGYRIELGEIEAVLQEHPAVAQAVATVWSELPTVEPRLVAYAVCAQGTRIEGEQLRRELRTRLPDYMIPAEIVVLASLPLTPNGKLDRRALPAPGVDQRRELLAPRTPLEGELREIWREELQIDALGVNEDFFDLGVDSLSAGRLFARIERTYGRRLGPAPMFQTPSIERLATLLSGEVGQRSSHASLVPMRADGGNPPLFCVHGGAGTVLFYHDLVGALGPEQPVYAFQAAGLYGGQAPHRTVQEMAVSYLEQLLQARPQGPYILGGFCFGGMVAFEMARRLRALDHEVSAVVMFNAPSAAYNRRYTPLFDGQGAVFDPAGQLRADLAQRDATLSASLRRHASGGSPAQRAGRLAAAARRRALVSSRARMRELRFEAYLRLRRPLPDDLREASAFQRIAARAQGAYEPAVLGVPILVFRSQGLYYEDDLGWGPHSTLELECVEVPGPHLTPRDLMDAPRVSLIAERMLARVKDGSPELAHGAIA